MIKILHGRKFLKKESSPFGSTTHTNNYSSTERDNLFETTSERKINDI